MTEQDQTHSWREFVAEAVVRLQAGGSENPENDARRIVERASGNEGASYYLGLDEPVTERGVAHFDAMVQRRLTGEPLQYVVGAWGFRDLDLLVDSRVLIPRPETEVVAGLAIAELQQRMAAQPAQQGTPLLAVDLGTGSGAIGLSIALEVVQAQVIITDVSTDALAVARANLAGLGRAATRVRVHEGPWFQALPSDLAGTVDVLVSNPPYVTDHEVLPAVVQDWEPQMALRAGPDGTKDLVHLVEQAPLWLRPGGLLVLEMAPQQTAHVAQLAEAAGFVDVAITKDLAQRDRAVVARWSN